MDADSLATGSPPIVQIKGLVVRGDDAAKKSIHLTDKNPRWGKKGALKSHRRHWNNKMDYRGCGPGCDARLLQMRAGSPFLLMDCWPFCSSMNCSALVGCGVGDGGWGVGAPFRAILTASWTAVFPVSLLPFIPASSSSSCARKHPPWELLSVRSLGLVNLTSSLSSEEDSLARRWARGEMAPYTSQLYEKEEAGYHGDGNRKKPHKGRKPSMTLGTKCAAPLVFFTRLPFMIWPSRLIPIYQERPDWVWR